jgi:hypothetical protein
MEEPVQPSTVPSVPDISTSAPQVIPAALRYLVFEPSIDHDATVVNYLFEVARVGGAVELSQDIGKPVPQAGECRVDVAALLQQLPAGNYVASVKAVSSIGTSSAAASPVFTVP